VKYIDEFRDGVVARQLAAAIAGEVRSDRRYHLMEFCGGHTHAISRYGIKDLLPVNVRMIHGPGCPVCVLPIGRIDNAIELAERPWTILATYADTMRVPASKGLSLQKAKARGLSDDEAFKVGDNGIGKWGGDTKKGSGPAVALPPEDWKPFGKNPSGKKVLVKANGREVVAELRDTMPSKANITNGCLIDLNPDACEALDLSPPVKIHCTWQWV